MAQKLLSRSLSEWPKRHKTRSGQQNDLKSDNSNNEKHKSSTHTGQDLSAACHRHQQPRSRSAASTKSCHGTIKYLLMGARARVEGSPSPPSPPHKMSSWSKVRRAHQKTIQTRRDQKRSHPNLQSARHCLRLTTAYMPPNVSRAFFSCKCLITSSMIAINRIDAHFIATSKHRKDS